MLREIIVGFIVAVLIVGSIFTSAISYKKVKFLETRVEFLQNTTSTIFDLVINNEEFLYSTAYLSFSNIDTIPQTTINELYKLMEERRPLWNSVYK